MGQGASSVACSSSVEERVHLLPMPYQCKPQAPPASQDHHHHRHHLRQQQQPEEDLTFQVPDECLELVFQKLDSTERAMCSLVCSRWHKLEGRSRHRLTLQAHTDLVPLVPQIFMRFVQVTKLTLKCDRKDPSINDPALFLIASHCHNLSKLKLKGCKDLTDTGIHHLSQLLSHSLRKFSCASCGFGATGLSSIINNCTDLQSLAVKRLKGVSSASSSSALSSSSSEIIINPENNNSIRKLCLKEVRNARMFSTLITGSKNLQSLKLVKNLGQWDKLLESIFSDHHPDHDHHLSRTLTELQLERLQLTDRGLQAVARCKGLEALYIVKASECTNFGLSAIATGCTNLKRLRLDGWRSSRIGDEGLISIAKRCRDLEELVLIRMNSVSVASLTLLGSNCTSIQRLAVCNCESFGDVELACVASRFKALRKLCVRSCPISNVGVHGLNSGCPALTRLKIRNCCHVTSVGMSELRVRCGRALWISLINDLLPPVDPRHQLPHHPSLPRQPLRQLSTSTNSSSRINRVVQGSMKMHWPDAVSCHCGS